jgi:hypothetical protein
MYKLKGKEIHYWNEKLKCFVIEYYNIKGKLIKIIKKKS